MTAKPSNIHIIDADPKFRRLLLSALEPYGARIIQSTSLREADLELPVSSPDLIVMDSVQPDGDGLKWLREKRSAGLSAPIIFLNSGCHSTEVFCELVNLSAVKVVMHKPLTAGTLAQVFEQHFNHDEAAPEQKVSNDLDEIEREIKALSLEYIRELPDRFRLLARQVEDLKIGRGEAASAKNEAHKIKGTASSYGVHDVGEQAIIIDDCLKRLSSESIGSPELWVKLETAIMEALRLSEAALEKADAETRAPAVYDERSAMSAVGLSSKKGQTIVIVDDDTDFTRRVSLILGYEDMRVYSFNDAKQIVSVLGYLKPDLLILDLNMPDMDGFEVCKRIRIDGRFNHLPIVFLTAQTGWETRVAAFDSGGDDYIPKPVVNQELIARIRVRAEKSRLQDEVTNQTSVNKLLWQALYMLLLQQNAAESSDLGVKN